MAFRFLLSVRSCVRDGIFQSVFRRILCLDAQDSCKTCVDRLAVPDPAGAFSDIPRCRLRFRGASFSGLLRQGFPVFLRSLRSDGILWGLRLAPSLVVSVFGLYDTAGAVLLLASDTLRVQDGGLAVFAGSFTDRIVRLCCCGPLWVGTVIFTERVMGARIHAGLDWCL